MQLLSSDEETGRENPGANEVAAQPDPDAGDGADGGGDRETGMDTTEEDATATMPDGDSGAASSTTPFTRSAGPRVEGCTQMSHAEGAGPLQAPAP